MMRLSTASLEIKLRARTRSSASWPPGTADAPELLPVEDVPRLTPCRHVEIEQVVRLALDVRIRLSIRQPLINDLVCRRVDDLESRAQRFSLRREELENSPKEWAVSSSAALRR